MEALHTLNEELTFVNAKLKEESRVREGEGRFGN